MVEKTVWEVLRNRELTTEKQAFEREVLETISMIFGHCRAMVLFLSRGVEAFISRINSKLFKRGNKEYAFQWIKKLTTER